MAPIVYRITRPGEEGQLREIWQQAFQEAPVFAELYFTHLYRPGSCVAAEEGERLLSAIYLMEYFQVLLPGQMPLTCAYLYALGTLPAQQGRGLGAGTIQAAGREGYRRGNDLVCFIPATPSLAEWYRRILDVQPAFYCRRFRVEAGEHSPCRITRLSSGEYTALREELLKMYPHALPSPEAMELQEIYCSHGGGGLYRIEGAWGLAAAAADREDGVLNLKELLCPEGDGISAVRGLLEEFRLPEAAVKSPAFWQKGLGTVEEDCVLIPGGMEIEPRTEAYWGLSIE